MHNIDRKKSLADYQHGETKVFSIKKQRKIN
jgi:hypothetical protein